MTHLSTVSTLPAFSPFRQKTTSVAVSGQLLLRYSAAARCTWGYLGDEPRWQQPWPWPSCKQCVMHLHFCRIPPSFCSLLFWEDGWKLDESIYSSILRSQFDWNLFVLRHALNSPNKKVPLIIGVVILKSGKSKRESSLLIIRSITWDRSFETTTHIRTFHLVFTFLAEYSNISTKNLIYVVSQNPNVVPLFLQ